MNKTQRHLEDIILRQRDDIERQKRQLQVEYALVDELTAQADASDRLHKRLMADEKARHAAEKKAATEAATLKSIRDGFVPIEVLRHLVREEYKTTHDGSFVKTDLTLMLDNKHAVDKALLASVLAKPVTYQHVLVKLGGHVA